MNTDLVGAPLAPSVKIGILERQRDGAQDYEPHPKTTWVSGKIFLLTDALSLQPVTGMRKVWPISAATMRSGVALSAARKRARGSSIGSELS